eukprot:Amastigsp_a175558_17.p2 type:complete len:125 gc:universal Amastigsp_a175558_17:120-494(+)
MRPSEALALTGHQEVCARARFRSSLEPKAQRKQSKPSRRHESGPATTIEGGASHVSDRGTLQRGRTRAPHAGGKALLRRRSDSRGNVVSGVRAARMRLRNVAKSSSSGTTSTQKKNIGCVHHLE